MRVFCFREVCSVHNEYESLHDVMLIFDFSQCRFFYCTELDFLLFDTGGGGLAQQCISCVSYIYRNVRTEDYFEYSYTPRGAIVCVCVLCFWAAFHVCIQYLVCEVLNGVFLRCLQRSLRKRTELLDTFLRALRVSQVFTDVSSNTFLHSKKKHNLTLHNITHSS